MANSISPPLPTSRRVIQSLKSKYKRKRTQGEVIADRLTGYFGSVGFLIINVIWFAVWIAINTGLIPFFKPFDSFPFGLLTMIVSLEAIILSIFVLISQNRASRVEDLREEVDLQIDLVTEAEVTKLLKLHKLLLEKYKIDISDDKEFQQMVKPIDENKIEKSLSKQV